MTTWSLLASFTHNWSPTVATTVGAGYQNVESPLSRTNPALALGAADFEMDAYDIFANIAWSPVPKTTFMLDVHYGHADFNDAGTFAGVFNPFVTNPLATDNEGAFAVALDITRSF